MKPNETDWLINYYHKRIKTSSFKDSALKEEKVEWSLYKVIQSTGLMYGHSIHTDEVELDESWEEKDRIKVLFLDSLFRVYILFSNQIKDSSNVSEEEFKTFCKDVNSFYKVIYPDVVPRKGWFSFRKKKVTEVTEGIIENRVNLGNTWHESFWTSFFHNSLLYLDVIYFSIFYSRNEKLKVIKKAKEETCITILEMIASAANADEIIEEEERELFGYFFQSAQISKANQRDVKNLLGTNLKLDDINFTGVRSWLLKKYLMEVAILTIWSDKNVNKHEHDFLDSLYKKLDLSKEGKEQSFLAVESFVLEHQDNVHYLKSEDNFQIVKDRFVSGFSNVLNSNKDKIGTEIQESKELVSLLMKSKSEELTDDEKEKVRLQLMDVLKTIPLFVIIALPGTFLTLPLLLKLLPKSAFPTAFQNES